MLSKYAIPEPTKVWLAFMHYKGTERRPMRRWPNLLRKPGTMPPHMKRDRNTVNVTWQWLIWAWWLSWTHCAHTRIGIELQASSHLSFNALVFWSPSVLFCSMLLRFYDCGIAECILFCLVQRTLLVQGSLKKILLIIVSMLIGCNKQFWWTATRSEKQ